MKCYVWLTPLPLPHPSASSTCERREAHICVMVMRMWMRAIFQWIRYSLLGWLVRSMHNCGNIAIMAMKLRREKGNKVKDERATTGRIQIHVWTILEPANVCVNWWRLWSNENHFGRDWQKTNYLWYFMVTKMRIVFVFHSHKLICSRNLLISFDCACAWRCVNGK